jgi:protein-tyrosine kinase
MTTKEKNVLRNEDWTVLEQFDRNTGNILKYDPDTGQLDHASRKIVRETKILNRLIENGMILPGGWLTYKGLMECQNRLSPVDQKDHSKEGSIESLNNKDHLNNSLSPQAEKFLKTLWNSGATKSINPKASVSQIGDTRGSENDRQQEIMPVSAAKVLYDENAINKNLIALLNPQSFEVEQFKILRTHIFFPLSGEVPRMIAITSAVPGEGKSFVSSNLAVSIASDIDKYVLLIDCDLRKPSVHKNFGFKDDVPGLSEYLSHKKDLPSLLVHTMVDKLSILPAGSPVDNPSELLSSDKMEAMLTEVSQRYSDRLVILDTTPLTITAEAVTLSRHVDGVLVVVKQGYTLKDHLREIVKIIDREKIMGIVLNNVDMRSLTQYEYKKYSNKYYYNKPKD